MKTSKLAFDANLSRETTKVSKDKVCEDLVVVETISCWVNDHVRIESYYRSFSKEQAKDLNRCLEAAKDFATLSFLGMLDDGDATEAPVVEAPAAEAPAAKPVVSKSVAKRKDATKRKAPPSTQPVAVAPVAVVPVVEDDLSNFEEEDGLELPDVVEEGTVLYNKSLSDHAAQLSPIIAEQYGTGWKKDSAMVAKVRALIAALNEKVPVMDASGLVLKSFCAFCREQLEIK